MRYGSSISRCALLTVAVLAVTSSATWAADQPSTILAASSWLGTQQQVNGSWTDTLPFVFDGTNVAGLANAYRIMGGASIRTTAEKGADYIIQWTEAGTGNYLGDGLFALTEVAQWQPNPVTNTYAQKAAAWMAALPSFTKTVGATTYTGAQGYADYVESIYGTDKSQPAIYMAYYTMAAHAVHDAGNPTLEAIYRNNETVFRNKITNLLGKVDDIASFFPVGALGAGVWALAQTDGGLDSTVITSPSAGFPLDGKRLDELPGILHGRMDLAGVSPSDSAFVYLANDVYFGYTEDTAFAIMGLAAAQDANPGLGYAADITAAREALCGAVESNGTSHILVDGTYDVATVYGGRTLEALVPEPASLGILGIGAMSLLARRRQK